MFDLDGTLTDSKQPLTPRMAAGLRGLLGLLPVAITTGGTWELVEQQVLGHLCASEPLLQRLYLLPVSGTRAYERVDGAWVRRYCRDLNAEQRLRITDTLLSVADELGILVVDPWGEVIEDRGGQITYSMLGQQAPLALKQAWDPDGSAKEVLRRLVQERLPDMAVRSGRSTSVDVTRPGVDKAYGVRTLSRSLGLPLSTITYLGDRLGPGGNDEPVRSLQGVVCVEVTRWQQTARWVEALLRAGTP
ncbi:MAG: HAD-IIB family hydrolase [Actinomycetota bacterium]|nr:HAD-IIB family hydrolase [Actinomycetota bacterium]